jgi:hypothetical protein
MFKSHTTKLLSAIRMGVAEWLPRLLDPLEAMQ